jgi:hypothetical protein
MAIDFSLPEPDSSAPAKYPISADSAAAQVKELLAYYDFDISTLDDSIVNKKSGLTERASAQATFEKLIPYYREGRLENDKAGDGSLLIVQHLKEPKGTITEIQYKEFTGDNRIASDGKGADFSLTMAYAMMGSLSGFGEGGMRNLRRGDLRAMEALALGFFVLMS